MHSIFKEKFLLEGKIAEQVKLKLKELLNIEKKKLDKKLNIINKGCTN